MRLWLALLGVGTERTIYRVSMMNRDRHVRTRGPLSGGEVFSARAAPG